MFKMFIYYLLSGVTNVGSGWSQKCFDITVQLGGKDNFSWVVEFGYSLDRQMT